MKIVWSLLILLAFMMMFLLDFVNIFDSPDKNKNMMLYLTLLFAGIALSLLQVFKALVLP